MNILVKISDLQNFISYEKKTDFKKLHGWYSKLFLVYEFLPFLPSYKMIVVYIFEGWTEKTFRKSRDIYPRRY